MSYINVYSLDPSLELLYVQKIILSNGILECSDLALFIISIYNGNILRSESLSEKGLFKSIVYNNTFSNLEFILLDIDFIYNSNNSLYFELLKLEILSLSIISFKYLEIST